MVLAKKVDGKGKMIILLIQFIAGSYLAGWKRQENQLDITLITDH